MKVIVSVKNREKKLKEVERAEELIKELKTIFSWDLAREIELEISEPTSELADSETEPTYQQE